MITNSLDDEINKEFVGRELINNTFFSGVISYNFPIYNQVYQEVEKEDFNLRHHKFNPALKIRINLNDIEFFSKKHEDILDYDLYVFDENYSPKEWLEIIKSFT